MKQYFKYLLCLSFLFVLFSCSDDSSDRADDDMSVVSDNETGEEMDEEEMDEEEEVTGPTSETTIWDGPIITFEKETNTDPDVVQDVIIEDSVALTRNNDGGSLYNVARIDSTSDIEALINGNTITNVTPGIMWAIGELSDFESLDYSSTLLINRSFLDVNLVMYLVDEDICLSFVLKTWDQGQGNGTGAGGGFSYERSTMP